MTPTESAESDFFSTTCAALHCASHEGKRRRIDALRQSLAAGSTLSRPAGDVARVDDAGRPLLPLLVHPSEVVRRRLGSAAGRYALLHAIAHIEFNAINLALDACYRFRNMPIDYYRDWLGVAQDESNHFAMLQKRLRELGGYYGSLPAHAGLWSMSVETDYDVLARMALVPRVLEARGLDVTPGMIDKLRSAGDHASVEILQRILREEVDHVRVGNRWFGWLCEQRDLDPIETFSQLLRRHGRIALRGPFNREARRAAGFSERELAEIDSIEQQFRAELATD